MNNQLSITNSVIVGCVDNPSYFIATPYKVNSQIQMLTMMVRVIIKEFPDNYIFPCNQAIGVTGTLYLSKEFCQSTWGRSSTRLQLLQTIVTVTVGLQLGSDKTHKHTSPVIILS